MPRVMVVIAAFASYPVGLLGFRYGRLAFGVADSPPPSYWWLPAVILSSSSAAGALAAIEADRRSVSARISMSCYGAKRTADTSRMSADRGEADIADPVADVGY
jgi:hypothetical protein